ncbi:unnamed protein product [Rotaria sordida]|uniref:Uncharacterized protein n=1 Tax=Rotaria sordida TaxID=392033 RepID=A0A818JBL2_9BILA|nr:unnamed protein product [Rotaria sordida]
MNLKSTKISSIPTLTRILYLFLCENQIEADSYSKIFPSITADGYTSGSMAYSDLLTSLVYHIDSMFTAIHHDTLTFLLSYCPKYDRRN